ncbi:c-type cytochrome [Cupriavidus consociatus]|uniref:c-type cytochrome n=1 Tax=Cupriavidus consociatus TaxID=2821357 RepID=UPI001AE93B3D|nr:MULTISPECIES: c-type cytochrome [unclassified Cupriavidus]MBP0620893.1 cytochrome c4 [Cupriavidus sp. LEh25]MDK2657558.1 c-type cytochrome [Cupriavidus sp. LEh21]
MKKIVLISVAAITAALALVFYGPALIDLYRLDRFIDASAKAYQADGVPWPRVNDTCFACHGVKGNSLHQGYPSLAGQSAAYLETQLHNFASGARRSPNMGPLSMTMDDAQIKDLADYFSKQTVADNRYFKPDPQLRAKGDQLVAKGNCAACHGAQLMGHDQFPRLAGQGYDYILAQFDAFASGSRNDPTGMMKSIAEHTSLDDRKAIAHYLASLETKH